jgi:hypothetical protein
MSAARPCIASSFPQRSEQLRRSERLPFVMSSEVETSLLRRLGITLPSK